MLTKKGKNIRVAQLALIVYFRWKITKDYVMIWANKFAQDPMDIAHQNGCSWLAGYNHWWLDSNSLSS